MSSYSIADLHLHTTASDGTADPEELLAHVAGATELSLIAVTDHDTVAGALEARRLAPRYGVEVVVGVEVSTCEGHLIGLFVEEAPPPCRPAAEAAAAIRAQGGLVVAPHPFGMLVPSLGRQGILRPRRGPAWADHVDALEVFNASLWLPRSNRMARAFAAARSAPMLGGSDSHHLATVGTGWTRFPGRGAAALRRAIVRGQTEAGGCYWGLSGVAGVVAVRLRRGEPPVPIKPRLAFLEAERAE